MGPSSVRVAAWQCVPRPLDVAGNLARLDDVARRAAAEGAAVLVVPELFTTGYAIGAAAVADLAEPADGPTAGAVAEIAAAHRIAVVRGFAERGAGGVVHNAAGLVGPDGRLLAVHRKVHLWGEVDRAQFAAGDAAPRAYRLDAAAGEALDGVGVGMLVCYDVEFPEATRRLAAHGARLLLVPTANPVGCEDVQDVLLRARALESGCAIVYANYCGRDEHLVYDGRSMVVGPDGAVLAEATTHDEELLVADVPLRAAVGEAYLRDRREDLYRD
ncbi:nitrilase-related carbon-nitrogen hydrolase [Nocardioides zeae]|uniref:Nitrilase-related carbon-nitrogen hydrolase n=1 Tax=Nocardioides imazamoxiresistens TaxID=3231893 RepID=A0ABU3Q2H8_9ACTN|nr:nitrilase-related carbon-nitrogen hydrolase [Nocardioides zeae]MDT9595356.1 nitrilase-related carbon-nitrogen hydrolase [Nocardioides zeae]